MKRVMIIGQQGAGKSTLALAMGAQTGLPVVHIDQLQFKSGWVQRPNAEKDALCAEVHARDQWIFEGGLSATWVEQLERADTLIWLDQPLGLRMWRAFWRTLRHYGEQRPGLTEGCPEKFRLKFWKWIWRTRRTERRKMQAIFDAAPTQKQKHHLRSDLDVANYLQTLGPAKVRLTRKVSGE